MPDPTEIPARPASPEDGLAALCKEQEAEIARLRAQWEEQIAFIHRVANEACGAPDERHCTCVAPLRQEIARLKREVEDVNLRFGEHIAGWRQAEAALESQIKHLEAALMKCSFAPALGWTRRKEDGDG